MIYGPLFIFFLFGIVLIALYFIFLFVFRSRLVKEKREHLRNSFPAEIYKPLNIQQRFLLFLFLMTGALFIAGSECYFFFYRTTVFTGFIAVLFPLSIVFLAISNFISLDHYKLHVGFALSSFVLFDVALFMYGIRGIVSAHSDIVLGVINVASEPTSWVVTILSIVLLALLFNPKLSSWAKMEKVEIDGVTTYVKPKVNYLALYEWGYLILDTLFALFLAIPLLS